MQSEGSVTNEIGKLKLGDRAAAIVLWQRYFERLVRVARRRLPEQARRASDEEDVALDAFASFCRQAEQGRLPQVRNREDLWQLLVTMTIRMAIDVVRREGRQKRGGGNPSGTGQFAAGVNPDQLAGDEPTPLFVALVAEECQQLLTALDDDELESIALWKTEGYTHEEIAARLGVVLRTVERKVQSIRHRWSRDPQRDNAG